MLASKNNKKMTEKFIKLNNSLVKITNDNDNRLFIKFVSDSGYSSTTSCMTEVGILVDAFPINNNNDIYLLYRDMSGVLKYVIVDFNALTPNFSISQIIYNL